VQLQRFLGWRSRRCVQSKGRYSTRSEQSGIAFEISSSCQFPAAYKRYHAYCTTPERGTPQSEHQQELLGTALLIPPQDQDIAVSRAHYIGCLFTSVGYGRDKTPPDGIVEATRTALDHLAQQIEQARSEGAVVGEVWCVRINSKLFKVDWERSKEVLEKGPLDMKVVRPEGEDPDGPVGASGSSASETAKRPSDAAEE
jgi:hypothetical protein